VAYSKILTKHVSGEIKTYDSRSPNRDIEVCMAMNIQVVVFF